MTETSKARASRRQREVEGALNALKRARVRAEEIAAATGTKLIEWRDGQAVRVDPRARHAPSPDRADNLR